MFDLLQVMNKVGGKSREHFLDDFCDTSHQIHLPAKLELYLAMHSSQTLSHISSTTFKIMVD